MDLPLHHSADQLHDPQISNIWTAATQTPRLHRHNAIPHLSFCHTMAGPPKKRQKRDDKPDTQMPQKKFYRQRAHANPFSDHDLV